MFLARTLHSGKLKALFEVLFSNSQEIILTISKDGINSELTTVNNTTIVVKLPSSCFEEYVFEYEEPLYVGLGSHVNSFFKNLKNKSGLSLSISKPYTLEIIHMCDDNCSVTYTAAYISAQNICPIQKHEYDIDNGYIMSNSTFSSICKSFKSPTVNISKSEGQLSFGFELAGIASKTMTFGQKDSTQTYSFFSQFKSDAFVRICKLSLFADKTIRICVEEDKPLMIMAESPLGHVMVVLSNP